MKERDLIHNPLIQRRRFEEEYEISFLAAFVEFLEVFILFLEVSRGECRNPIL